MKNIVFTTLFIVGITVCGCLYDEDYTWSYTMGDNANQDGEPTWENTIARIMDEKCAECHASYVASYQAILPWINSGELEDYIEREHYIEGQDKLDVLYWLEIEAPETDNDVVE